MKQQALLLRLNPSDWPVWERDIVEDRDFETWFKTGRRKPETIHPGIPVVVLGTDGLGVVAFGETSSGVEFRSDPDWMDVELRFQEECKTPLNRVKVKLRRARIALEKLQEQPSLAMLYRRRETVSWIDGGQFDAIVKLLQQHPYHAD